MMKIKRKPEKGFSLIEVLTVIVIFAIILLTLIGVFIYGFNLISRSKQVGLATQIAQEEIEFIRNMNYDDISTYITGTSDFISYNRVEGGRYAGYDLSQLENVQGVLSLSDELSDSSRIVKLTATITWDYHRRQMKKDLVTYILKGGINKK